MTVESFKYAFKRFTICHLKEGWINNFIEKKNAMNKKVYRYNF
jgi:hypothetical protein